MREGMGLYRGKRLDNDEWVEGCVAIANGQINDGKCYICEMTKSLGCYCVDGENRVFDIGPFHEVDPETVGEFTGLTDKNGKRIFEGDIIGSMDGHDGYLSCESYIVGAVNWDDETLSWQVTNRIEAESYEILASDNETLEVIGNIHDNPELLNV